MNRLLAGTLATLNIIVAIAIVIGSAVSGGKYGQLPGDWNAAGLVLGAVVGVFAASVVGGIIALLVLIEGHLRVIASAARRGEREA